MKFYIHYLLLILPFSVNAQQMYKSVDKDGNVSYSSTPKSQAAEVEKITPPPIISDEQKLHSQQQQEAIKSKSELIGESREKRAEETAKRAEEKARKEAEKEALEPLEIHRQSTLNDPLRKPQPGKPENPIQPVPTPPIQPAPPPANLPSGPVNLPSGAAQRSAN